VKIAITVRVDVKDPAEWTRSFGMERAAEIRQDVKDYVGTNVQGLRVWEEVEAEVSWK
jgi:hypothetical protein